MKLRQHKGFRRIDPFYRGLSVVGYLNRFHHPHPGVYARYAARHIVLARSDADGAVRIEAGPGSLAVERYMDKQRRYWMDAADE